MILTEVTFDSVMYRVSNEPLALEHWWTPKISVFDPFQYQMEAQHGGYCQIAFGSIEFTPDFFDSSNVNTWPPPITGDLVIRFTDTTEAAAEELFQGKIHLSSFTRETVTYDVYGGYDSINLLEIEDIDYDENESPIPRAFGAVTYVQPLRLPDILTAPTYHKGYMLGSKETNWHVYDDGVDICSNVTDNGDGTFKLSAVPVGQVSISGIGTDSTLAEIVEWACGASYLNLTYNGTYARNPSPSLNHWATSQTPITQFLSEICAYFSHIFYIRGTTLYLVDTKINNGSRIITEFDYMPSEYNYNPPVSVIKTVWQYREAGEWRDKTGGGSGAVYVKETDHEVSVISIYPYGEEMEVNCFQENHDNILTALNDILDMVEKPMCNLKMPLTASPVLPGEKVLFQDTSLQSTTEIWIRARNITYDFDNYEVTVSGEGEIYIPET